VSSEPQYPKYPALLVISVMLATIIYALDTTIANVVLPHLQGSLQASQEQVAWVLTSYIVVSAIVTPLIGRLSDRYGVANVLLWSVGVFTFASVLCGTATSLTQMVLYRMLQGAAGASLIPLSQTVLLNAFPREKHAQALAVWSVGVMAGPILGPTLGGYLTDKYSWHWVFLINLPVGLLTLIGIAISIPRTRTPSGRPFDYLGYLLIAMSMGALQLCLDRGNHKDWFESGEVIAEAVVAVLCLYMFIVHSLTTKHPFFSPALFRDVNFLLGTALIGVLLTGVYATMALMPLFLQQLQGYSVQETGLLLSPRGIGMAVSSIMAGRLMGRVDPRWLGVTGLLCLAYSFWDTAQFTMDVGREAVVVAGLIMGFGIGFVSVPLMTATFATLALSIRVEGAVLYSMLRNIGASMGVTIAVTILSRTTQATQEQLVEHVGILDTDKWQVVRGVLGEYAEPAYAVEVARQAAQIAYINDFTFLFYLTLAGIPLVVLMRQPKSVLPPAVPADMH
jgi:MFS transporter, DHA2 family, multidrug resistance protein